MLAVVEDGNLTVQISTLRKLLGKGAISTVTGFGYRFTLPEDGQVAAPIPSAGPPLPDKPSLAVLPFANLSGDPSQEYFIDGVVGDIINGLSRVRAFFVIAQNSSFTYKGCNVSVAEVGRELGVRYVLEGSFQQAGQMLRVSTQLVEAATGRTIWSARFDGARDDVFVLQDEITSKIVTVIEPKLVLAEVERAKTLPTENLRAYELCLQALPMVYAPVSLAAVERAIELTEAAIIADPDYSFAKALHAWAHSMAYASRWLSFERAQKGLEHVKDALDNHRDDPTTLAWAGHSIAYLGRQFETGMQALERALQLNPNSAVAIGCRGWVSNYIGDTSRAIESFEVLHRLSPLDPYAYATYSGLGVAYCINGQLEEAVKVLEHSRALSSDFTSTLLDLVGCYVALGRDDDAMAAADKLRFRQPDLTLELLRKTTPHQNRDFVEFMCDGLRATGFPEA